MATSYSNPGGSGHRCYKAVVITSSGVTWNSTDGIPYLVDGETGENLLYAVTPAPGAYIRFQFESSIIIDEIKWYQSTTNALGTWKFQGSANGTDWSDVGGTFAWGGATTQTITSPNGNTTGYFYYRLLMTDDTGANWGGTYTNEIEFKTDWAVPVPATAYANFMGEAGGNSGLIATTNLGTYGAISSLIDGGLLTSTDFYWSGETVDASKYIDFDFGANKVITEMTYHQQDSTNQGVWRWYGKPDGGGGYSIIGASDFTLGGSALSTDTSLSANTTGYRYYRMEGVSGSTSSTPWVYEMYFKLGDVIVPSTGFILIPRGGVHCNISTW